MTDQISIWDVGIEHDEEPGVGAHIGGPEGEDDANASVRMVPAREYSVPAAAHIRVTIATP